MNYVHFRNAIYQGETSTNHSAEQQFDLPEMPLGAGLLYLTDAHTMIYASKWAHMKFNGNVVCFIDHGSYLYGHFEKENLEGFGVYRWEDITVMAMFQKG